jgi:diguanylate cyclase (GGDEF)-like protein/PAS domain S-box-containing protein
LRRCDDPPVKAGLDLLPRRRRVLLAALALFAIVFALRFVSPDRDNGITFLYVLPIILIAVEFGRSAGVLAGLASLVLFAIWSAVDGAGFGVVAHVARGITFAAVGALTGAMADRLRATAESAASAARHFELARDLLCTATFDGYLVQLNGAWEETLGWTPEELKSRPFVEFVHPDDRERTRRSAAALAEGGASTGLTNRYMTKDGGWRWIEWSSRADLEHRLIHAAARDITERRDAEQRVRDAEARFRRAFDDSPAGMALVGVRGDDADLIIEVNDALIALTGLTREQLVGTRPLAQLTHADDAAALREGMQRLVDGEIPTFRTEFRLLGTGGRERWVDLTTSTVDDADGNPLYRISQVYDVDARRRAEERLRHFADHDALSGLYNRRRFHEELERELMLCERRGGRGAVLLMDLDNFKAVNDTLGHAAGDAVIERVGAALTARLRSGDVTARLGGDEFGVILRRVTPEEADRVAGELLGQVEAALHASADGAGVSLSIGVAPFGGRFGTEPDELLKAADAAMYRAKAGGGGAVARAS